MSLIPYTEENRAKIQAVGEAILGTCGYIDRAIENEFGDGTNLDDLADELLQELDDIAEECQCCGWWCEPGEIEDGECVDCRH